MSAELEFAKSAAKDAGSIALNYFRNVEVEYKNDDSPVTLADREVEQFLRSAIRAKFPEDAVLGEEYGEEGTSRRRWVIDPIDGTKSFIAGVPLFSVLVALEVDGVPTVGVAHFPALGETYSAETGIGSFCNDNPIQVTKAADLSKSLVVCGSIDSFRRTGRLEWLLRVTEAAYATRTWGDAYGHCLAARGDAAAMIDPQVNLWDVCALAVIVQEAGGVLTDFRGNPTHTSGEAITGPEHITRNLLDLS